MFVSSGTLGTDCQNQKVYLLAIALEIQSIRYAPFRQKYLRPVAGGGAGGARAPPEIFRLELNSATKVEFLY